MPHILVERDFLLQFDGYFAVEVLFSSGDSAAGVSAEGTEDAEGAEVPAVGEADSVGRGAAGREATAGFVAVSAGGFTIARSTRSMMSAKTPTTKGIRTRASAYKPIP